MTSKLTMGVDLGTQSVKVLIYDASAKRVSASAACTLDMTSVADGTREQDAADWIAAFHNCLEQISGDIKKQVTAVGVSGQQHGFVPLDADGKVLAPIKLWCDTSTEQEAREIIDQIGSEIACRTLTGNSVPVGFTASKILWLKKNKPDAYARLATILLPHDYLNFYLTGNRCMEYGDASGTGLLDVRTRDWSQPLLQAVDAERDLLHCLPPLIEATASCGTLLPEITNATGLPEDALVSAGGGDNMMAAIGTGNVQSGELTASLGTSGTLFAYADKPIVDNGGDLAAFCSSTGGWLPLGCTMNCTVATEQMRDLLAVGVDELEALAADVPAGSDGVLTLPFYNGERMPNLPGGKAVLYGLDMENCSRGHLLHSAMEAAAFSLKTALNAFTRCGMQFDTVTLTGGGSTSPLWRQICADVLALPVRILEQKENAAFGAALQALWCLEQQQGNNCSIAEITNKHLSEDTSQRCNPDPKSVQQYHSIYQTYQKLVAAMTPLFEDQ